MYLSTRIIGSMAAAQLVLLMGLLPVVSAIEPVSSIAGLTALGSMLWAAYDKTPCRVMECCDSYSIIQNFTGLEENIQSRVYGQHLMQDIVVRAIKAHFDVPQPSKALVLSFHGTQGSGKNFVSSFIRDAIFHKGAKSKFHHFYSGGLDFPNPSKRDIYRLDLLKEIRESVQHCERSMFVFDDIQKMPAGILDAVKPYIDYHEEVHNIDYRKSIFIFLSNTGAGLITQKTLDLWREGKQREDIKLQDFETMIKNGAFNEDGGLHKSENVKANLIDHYIPFLPLEEKHVKSCIRDEFRRWGYKSVPSDAIDSILEDMVFGPGEEKVFSTSGCKRVSAKVAAYVQGKRYGSF